MAKRMIRPRRRLLAAAAAIAAAAVAAPAAIALNGGAADAHVPLPLGAPDISLLNTDAAAGRDALAAAGLSAASVPGLERVDPATARVQTHPGGVRVIVGAQRDSGGQRTCLIAAQPKTGMSVAGCGPTEHVATGLFAVELQDRPGDETTPRTRYGLVPDQITHVKVSAGRAAGVSAPVAGNVYALELPHADAALVIAHAREDGAQIPVAVAAAGK